MFDNLREQADSVPFYEDEAQFQEVERSAPPKKARRTASTGGHFLGLTPVQRFILAMMLLLAVCALGSMFLLVAGKIGL